MDEKLFLFEAFVYDISLDQLFPNIPSKNKLIVAVRLGNIATLVINPDVALADFETCSTDVGIDCGKAYLFSSSSAELLETLEQPLEVTLMVEEQNEDVGCCKIPWQGSFKELAATCDSRDEDSSPTAMLNTYLLYDNSDTIKGNIRILLRMSYLGANIQVTKQSKCFEITGADATQKSDEHVTVASFYDTAKLPKVLDLTSSNTTSDTYHTPRSLVSNNPFTTQNRSDHRSTSSSNLWDAIDYNDSEGTSSTTACFMFEEKLRGGGGPSTSSPQEECRDVLEELDKIVARYKSAMGSVSTKTLKVGSSIHLTSPCSVKSESTQCSCDGQCDLKYRDADYTEPNCEIEEYEDAKSYDSRCEGPDFPKFSDDQKYNDAFCIKCGKKHRVRKIEKLPPIHWECPDPLPVGKCLNPNCPIEKKLKEESLKKHQYNVQTLTMTNEDASGKREDTSTKRACELDLEDLFNSSDSSSENERDDEEAPSWLTDTSTPHLVDVNYETLLKPVAQAINILPNVDSSQALDMDKIPMSTNQNTPENMSVLKYMEDLSKTVLSNDSSHENQIVNLLKAYTHTPFLLKPLDMTKLGEPCSPADCTCGGDIEQEEEEIESVAATSIGSSIACSCAWSSSWAENNDLDLDESFVDCQCIADEVLRGGPRLVKKPNTAEPVTSKSKLRKKRGKWMIAKRSDRHRFIFQLGNRYSGMHAGHKQCVPETPNVPRNMGWMWNLKSACFNLKQRKGWKPGMLGKTMLATIQKHRQLKQLPPLGQLKHGVIEDDNADEVIVPRPTLQVKRRQNIYYISMKPIKDTADLEISNNPYMQCKPIQFKIKKHKKRNEYEKCTCGGEEEDPSTQESDLDLEFTPPAAVIGVPRVPKTKNVTHIDTQYNRADFVKPKKRANQDKKKNEKDKKKKKK